MSKTTSAAVPFAQTSTTTRLHISPLDADLLPAIIPASILPQAQNISFHTIETFPESRYGFVDLPTADAERLKKKLHGAILKGAKMRIEKARPDNMPVPSGEDAAKADGDKKTRRKAKSALDADLDGPSKKRKRTDGVYDGIELRSRKLKRSADAPAEPGGKRKGTSKQGLVDKKDRAKPNHSSHSESQSQSKTSRKLSGTSDTDAVKVKAKKKSESVETESATKLSSPAKPASESVDLFSKSNEEGRSKKSLVNEVNEDSNKVQSRDFRARGNKDAKGVVKVVEAAETDTQVAPSPTGQALSDEDDTSSSGTSSSSDDDSEDDSEAELDNQGNSDVGADGKTQRPTSPPPNKRKLSKIVPPSPATSNKLDSASARPISASSTRSLSIKIPPPISTSSVHPLEALYKKKPAASDSEPFTFFGRDEDTQDVDATADQNDAGATQPPMTPFTKQDFEWRRQRSAAPTPDTAHPTRNNSFWTEIPSYTHEEEDIDEEAEEDEGGGEKDDGKGPRGHEVVAAASSSSSGNGFQSWFWENRSSINRSWKDRRKTAAKEKRQRENKARTSRIS